MTTLHAKFIDTFNLDLSLLFLKNFAYTELTLLNKVEVLAKMRFMPFGIKFSKNSDQLDALK